MLKRHHDGLFLIGDAITLLEQFSRGTHNSSKLVPTIPCGRRLEILLVNRETNDFDFSVGTGKYRGGVEEHNSYLLLLV